MITNITTEIKIDLYGETKLYEVSAKQADKATRIVSVALLNNGAEYKIPQDAMIIVNVRKPDGKYCFNDCRQEDNHVLIELTNQMLAAAGTATAEVEIRNEDGSQVLTSASFTIEIEQSMRNEAAIESSNEFTVLDDKLKELVIAEALRESNESIRKETELQRIEDENIRKASELTRKQQEQDREYKSSKAVENAEYATRQATAATAEASKVIDKATNTLSNEKQLQSILNEVRETHGDIEEKHLETVEAATEANDALAAVNELISSAAVGLSADMVKEVKKYYDLAAALNNGITTNIDCGNPYSIDQLDCDGGTPFTTEAVKIDCGTPLSL